MSQPVARSERPLIAIAGPTGSGKSESALALARRWPIEVVNCDSLQIYRYLDIGTAKLAPEERAGVPHHLMDLLNPDEEFSAGEYVRRARPIVRSISEAGRLPVVVGGTGFYLKALTEGLFPGPARDEGLRRALVERERRRPGILHRFLRCADPEASARIHANDTKKLVRAAEVCLLAQRPLSVLHKSGREELRGFRTLKIVLDPPRDELYKRLDRRATAMFARGLIDEVREIMRRGYSAECKPFESLGYRQAIQVIQGEISVPEAIESTRRDTRRYAKRQWTWFRRESNAVWLKGFGDSEETQSRLMATAAEYLSRFR